MTLYVLSFFREPDMFINWSLQQTGDIARVADISRKVADILRELADLREKRPI